MYYRKTPHVGQSQDGLTSAGIERAYFGYTPEAAKIVELGHQLDWMRNSAVRTGNYDKSKVDQLVPTASRDSIIDYIGRVILGPKQPEPISSENQTRQLLAAEALLGGQLFEPEAGVAQEFFALDPEKWMHYRHETQKPSIINLNPQVRTTELRYRVIGGGIHKYINGRDAIITEGDVNNLCDAVKMYVYYVGKTIYPELYRQYQAWEVSDKTRLVAAQVHRQTAYNSNENVALAA